MPKQRGAIKLQGAIGEIAFYKSSTGFHARTRTEIPAERFASDPIFQRTRENNAEFGRAGKASKLLRTIFTPQIKLAKDRTMSSRLTKQMMRVLRADSTNGRGLRTVEDGDMSLLQGFNCNGNASLSAALAAPVTVDVNRATGEVSLDLLPFVPSVMVSYPDGATHFRLTAAAAAVNFATEAYTLDVAESGRLPINDVPTAAISLTATMPAASTDPIFLLVGIDFTQEVNGTHYALKTGAFNALSIVQVDLV